MRARNAALVSGAGVYRSDEALMRTSASARRSLTPCAPNLYYRWSKEFLEAGKKRLLGDTTREATSTEVQDLRRENSQLKQVVAEAVLENRVLKKSAGLRLGGQHVRLTAVEKHEIIRLVDERVDHLLL